MYFLVLLGKKDIFCIFEEIIGDLWHLADYTALSLVERYRVLKYIFMH